MSGASPIEFGPYLVYECLGTGGMASVHRAEMHGIAGFRRQVALKRLLPSAAASPDLVQSFIDEARLASHLHHTNVAQTYDFGKVDDVYFIAMEYIAGPTLMQIIRQCVAAAGRMPLPIAVNVLVGICDALDYAHNLKDDAGKPLGVIHRDVSPSNVMVSNSGVAKLIDFGIAKAKGVGRETVTGIIKGKFGYIAPEYIKGVIDSRSDLFGFGVIAYELLTNSRLFHVDDDFETLRRVRELDVIRPSRINPQITTDLDDIVMTALQRDPATRWQSAGAARTALTNLSRDLGSVVTGADVVDWMQWAFSQLPRREDSGLAEIIDSLGQPSVVVEVIDEVDQRERDSVMTILGKRPSAPSVPAAAPAAAPAPAPAPAPARSPAPAALAPVTRRVRRSNVRVLLLLLVLALAIAAASIWYLGIPVVVR